MKGRIRSRIAAGVAVALFASTAAMAYAQVTTQFDLPRQPLVDSLRAIASRSNLNVFFEPKLVAGREAPALKAQVSADEALAQILQGSGLTYRRVDDKTINILPLATAPAAPASSAPPTTSQSPAIEEIVVTAQKRMERLIDTPQSVTVVSGEALSRLGATQFRDVANTVPGLSFQTAGAGFNQVTLRGVTAGYDISPTVGIYVDDVPYGSTGKFARGAQLALDVGLFDVDRIEVLRGPQGTLYGASTMGGLVKYVSKPPDATRFRVDARTGVSSIQDGGMSYDGALAVNAPVVTDKVALRASGFYSRDGGYIDNLALGDDNVNAADIYGGRAEVLLTPTDALTIRIGGFAQNISRDGSATASYTLAGAPVDGSLDQRHLIAEPFEQKFHLFSGMVSYEFGPATLTSISSYQTTRAEFTVDNPSLLPVLASALRRQYSALGVLNNVTTDKFTQEVRLASAGSSTVEWLVGGFYTHEKSVNEQQFTLLTPAGQPATNDLYTFSNPSRYEEYAAFGDVTWHLNEKFDVSGGLRQAHNDQVATQIGSGILVSTRPTRRASDSVRTYLANARYHVSDRATAYVRYATGYRPGGPNAVANDPTTGAPLGLPSFEPDRLKSYEVGFKAETPERLLGVDIATYHIDWDNIQILTTSNGFSVTANAPGGATVDGAELALTSRPVRGFTATGAFAYQDARLAEASTALRARKGERLPNVPRFTASLNADYEFASALQPTLGASLRYVSERMSSFDDNRTVVQYRLPEYATVDVRTGFALNSVALQLYVHNVFDKRGQQIAPTGLSSLTGPVDVSTVPPRTIGVSATAQF